MRSPLAALSEIPRSIAVPAIGASLAYLNGKYAVARDIRSIGTLVKFGIDAGRAEKADAVNGFYVLEKHALDPAASKRTFLAVPQDPEFPTGIKTEWTYEEAYDTVLRYAQWLKETHYVQRNEIVAIDFTNKPTFIWLWFALWSLGAIPAFINSNLRSKAFVHCVKVSTARLLILDPAIREALDDETIPAFGPDEKGRGVETVILENEGEILAQPAYRAPDSARNGTKLTDTSLLIYTSGTTGLPKAANVPWVRLIASFNVWPKILGLKPDDRYFTVMPLYHSSASMLAVCQALGAGCAVVVAPRFSARICMQQITETKATAFQYIGELARYLTASPPSPYDKAHNVRLAFGNGMRPDVWQRFKDRFNIGTIIEFYGATEGPAASYVVSNNDFLRGAIGFTGGISRTIFGGNSVLLVHDSATDLPYRDPITNFCKKVATNESGELVYPLDPNDIEEKYSGYHGNPSASASKILRDVFKKGDAYYRTGDLQRQDADGRWWFMDRIGDTFRWKSENVSTAEVSGALGLHQAVREANVYGVELPNHDGRAGCAAISLIDSHASETLSPALCAELAQTARKNLPKYAIPLFLRVPTAELDVTGTFKHQKVDLRNAGVDPAKTGKDKMYWLPPGAEAYEEFGEGHWKRIQGGKAKL